MINKRIKLTYSKNNRKNKKKLYIFKENNQYLKLV